MKTRPALRLAIPCACFAAAWMVTHALRPAPLPAAPVMPVKATVARKAPAVSPSEAAQRIAAALTSAPSGDWQAAWTRFADTATVAELTAVATGPAGMAQNLAWEELGARRPEVLRDLLKSRANSSALFAAAAAALAARDAEAGLALVRQFRHEAAQHAVLATIAWHDPAAAQRGAEKLPTLPDSRFKEDAARTSIAAAWTRRDPAAATAAGFTDVNMWMRTDAISALRHLLSDKDGGADRFKLWMVAAALRQSPAETVRLIEAHPSLREVCGEATNVSYGASMLASWYAVSPESCLDAVEIAAARTPALKPHLFNIIAEISPEAAAALAERFPEFDLAAWERRRVRPEPDAALDFDPVTAADALLAALEQHPPAAALAATGLNTHQAAKLGELLALQLPEKARALAAKVPLEEFDADPSAFPFVARSALKRPASGVPASESAAADRASGYQSTTVMLKGDPAGYAATADPAGNNGWAACNAVTCWAPHDYPAAAAYTRRLPAGPVRQRAEVALAMELAVQNPAAGLAAMRALPESVWAEFPHDQGAGVWLCALHQIVLSGGDWEKWQAQTPAPLRDRVQTLARDALATDAALLAVLRGKR